MRVMIVGQKWLAAELPRLCLARGDDVAAVSAPRMDDRLAALATADGIPVCQVPGRLTGEWVPAGVDVLLCANAHVFVTAEARACRLVVMPEWQGAGVGLRFLDAVCELWRTGANRYGRPMPTLFHTSHPGLASALRRSARWTQVSAKLLGDSKARSIASLQLSAARNGTRNTGTGYGGHFRAVQGFRYLGEQPCES